MQTSRSGDQNDHQAGDRRWLMSDAWVFAAVANDQPARAHTLAEIIAIAHGINHAVLTEPEFTTAIARLLSAGLIEADAVADQC